MSRLVTCGVLVSDDGGRILLGQATGTKRWDIPKGVANEDPAGAAARELWEETGLRAEADMLRPLGRYRYLPAKDLVLFAWRPPTGPEPESLRCSSTFRGRDGRMWPELARFALLPWDEAMRRVGKNMARVLAEIGPARALSDERR